MVYYYYKLCLEKARTFYQRICTMMVQKKKKEKVEAREGVALPPQNSLLFHPACLPRAIISP